MLDRNTAALQASLEAVNSEGLEGALRTVDEFAHSEFEWTPLIGRGVEGRTYRGREGMRSFWRDLFDAFEEVRYERIEYRSAGDDSVVLLCEMVLKGRGSGVPVRQELGVVYEFEDGLLRRGIAHNSHEKALAEAIRA